MCLRPISLFLIFFQVFIVIFAQNIDSPVLLYLIYPTAPEVEQNQIVLLQANVVEPNPDPVPVQIIQIEQIPQISTLQLQSLPVIQQQIPIQQQQIPVSLTVNPINPVSVPDVNSVSVKINEASIPPVSGRNIIQSFAERVPVSVKQVQPSVQLDENTYCPNVPETPNFDLEQQLGTWYIVDTSLDIPECAFAIRKESFRYYGLSSTYWDNRSQVKPLNLTHYIGQPSEQILTVNYIDRKTNNMVNKYYGRTSRGSGGSYTNKFTTGATSNVTIVAADYNRESGYLLMITCTKQSNGALSVNTNILSRTPNLDPSIVRGLRSILTQSGLTELESRLKANNQKNCYLLGQLSQKKAKLA